MKKLTIFLFIFIFFAANNVFANTTNTPKVDAQGAVLIEQKTGRILFGKNENEPLPMASTTKIMTAILALENGNLNDIVKVSKNATKAPPVKMNIKENEEIKLNDLLHSLMLQSHNDSAVAIAEHIGGSVENFCNQMTLKAQQIGAKNTVFKTPNGLDAEGHQSTPYDMALITSYALNNEQFVKIINTKQLTFKSNFSTYTVENKNRLLSEYEGANGVKTGFTNKAGHCFVGSATRNDLTLISVVLASGWGNKGKEQKWKDTKTLLNYGFDNFSYEKIFDQNTFKEKANIIKGEQNTVDLYCKKDVLIPISKEEKDKINIQIDYVKTLTAPVNKDEKVGVISVYIEDELIEQIDILTKQNIKKKNFSSYFNDIINKWLSMAI